MKEHQELTYAVADANSALRAYKMRIAGDVGLSAGIADALSEGINRLFKGNWARITFNGTMEGITAYFPENGEREDGLNLQFMRGPRTRRGFFGLDKYGIIITDGTTTFPLSDIESLTHSSKPEHAVMPTLEEAVTIPAYTPRHPRESAILDALHAYEQGPLVAYRKLVREVAVKDKAVQEIRRDFAADVRKGYVKAQRKGWVPLLNSEDYATNTEIPQDVRLKWCKVKEAKVEREESVRAVYVAANGPVREAAEGIVALLRDRRGNGARGLVHAEMVEEPIAFKLGSENPIRVLAYHDATNGDKGRVHLRTSPAFIVLQYEGNDIEVGLQHIWNIRLKQSESIPPDVPLLEDIMPKYVEQAETGRIEKHFPVVEQRRPTISKPVPSDDVPDFEPPQYESRPSDEFDFLDAGHGYEDSIGKDKITSGSKRESVQ